MQKVDWQPLHEVAYRELRHAIMTARYAPGEAITVRAAAAALGVSPMPVRAAFSRLVAERVVESRTRGGIAIPAMTRERFDDLVDMRVLLEGTAAERAAGRVTPAQLSTLHDLAVKLADAVKVNDRAYLELNQVFKFTVCGAAGSHALTDLVERLWLQYGPFMHYYAQDIKLLSETDEYSTIVDALRRGDAKEARLATARDILGGAAFIVRIGQFSDEPDSEDFGAPRLLAEEIAGPALAAPEI